MRLRACLANVLRACGVMLGPTRSIASWALSASAAGLVADGLEFGDAIFEHWVGEIGDAVLDSVIEPLEFGGCFGRALAQLGNMCRAALGAFLAAIENARKN